MSSKQNMQDAHISGRIRELHLALIRIVGVMNRPEVDERMVQASGIALDRALFPVLVTVERFGPIGMVDLAGRVGRDHTTMSRQVGKLESHGLVERRADETDGRVRRVVVTPKGKAMTDAVDQARERMGRALFADWEQQEMDEFVRLLRKFAEDIEKQASSAKPGRP
ncbi:Transcriptional regulator, MarR family [Candidatus Burkholderia verschuerenii]|uniref:Transcriptional regulator, MarR family n=1 Tax=Candidatus Burkholderia verschuerenii TaxID=242163 RepID=A0A0L0MCD0_9BURK|nr:MarR family transcriptional regulator [Candidatus Burkholderia verschuerenii]KND59951.1 Transcriptional regulator, MarR family [Candidatus Burkholderia verschuerenii]